MELFELDDLIPGLLADPTYDQLDEIYDAYCRDFVDKPFIFKGARVKIAMAESTIEGYEDYPETFVHLITRKGQGRQRVFDRHRANKIHWIKCILENYQEEEITYFEYPEPNGKLREYYWYKEGDFLVIMQRITPDYIIISCFHVDDKRNREYYGEREKWYKDKA
jgi:hypothetical protein